MSLRFDRSSALISDQVTYCSRKISVVPISRNEQRIIRHNLSLIVIIICYV